MGATPHAKGLVDLADKIDVAYAYSPSEGRRRAFAERFAFPLTDSLDTILDDRSVEAVLVVTPANTHRDIAERCAAAGKHVLLEKPVDITTAQAEAAVAACRKAGVKLGIVLQHRFRPAGVRLAELLAAGELGRIVGCSTVIRLWRPQAYYDEPGRGSFARDGGGVLLSQGIHTLDLLISFAGLPVEAMAIGVTLALAVLVVLAVILVGPLIGLVLLRELLLRRRDDAKIMFGVLKIIFRRDRIAGRRRVTCELDVFFGDMGRIAADFHIRAVGFITAAERVWAPAVVIVVIIVAATAHTLLLLTLPHGSRIFAVKAPFLANGICHGHPNGLPGAASATYRRNSINPVRGPCANPGIAVKADPFNLDQQ